MIVELVLLAALAAPPAGASGAEPAAAEAAPTAGLHAYASLCAPCHGMAGDGTGPYARDLPGPPPRDFTEGLFQYRSTYDRVRTDDLVETIRHGMPGTEMPAFRGLLGARQAAAVAEIVLTFSERGRNEPPGEVFEIPPEPSRTEASVAAGRELFQDNCVSCHGPGGRGDGPKADELTDAWGRAIRPRDLVAEPLESGGDPRRVYHTLAVGMEGTPMPPYGFLLGEDEIWHLVHYLEDMRAKPGPIGRFFRDDPTPAGRCPAR